MAFYIEVPNHKGKAQQIVDIYDAHIIPEPCGFWQKDPQSAFICVVDNGRFEAAAFCYDERELADFKIADGRPRTWLIMDRKKACKLTGFEKVDSIGG